jgi:L-lactate dehydrogenase
VYSQVSVKGIGLESFLRQIGKEISQEERVAMADQVKSAAYRIIGRKGATYYGIASALLRIVRAIWRNENVILPVSSLAQGEYDIHDVCLALPTLVNKHGAQQIFDLSLSQAEYEGLLASANTLKEYTSQLPQ